MTTYTRIDTANSADISVSAFRALPKSGRSSRSAVRRVQGFSDGTGSVNCASYGFFPGPEFCAGMDLLKEYSFSCRINQAHRRPLVRRATVSTRYRHQLKHSFVRVHRSPSMSPDRDSTPTHSALPVLSGRFGRQEKSHG